MSACVCGRAGADGVCVCVCVCVDALARTVCVCVCVCGHNLSLNDLTYIT